MCAKGRVSRRGLFLSPLSLRDLALVPAAPPPASFSGRISYLALPRHVPSLEATTVERDQKVGAAVSVLQGQLCIAHFLAGRPCGRPVSGLWCRMEMGMQRVPYAVVSRRILTPFRAAIERLRATIAQVDVVVAEVRCRAPTQNREAAVELRPPSSGLGWDKYSRAYTRDLYSGCLI